MLLAVTVGQVLKNKQSYSKTVFSGAETLTLNKFYTRDE